MPAGFSFHNVANLMTLLKLFNGVGHVLPVQHGTAPMMLFTIGD
jgi:hypothetical protein